MNTILMDETAVYLDDPRLITVERTGVRHVVMNSTGFLSMRITAVLAVSASGRKLTPLSIWKGKNQDIATVNGCWVVNQPLAWVDQGLLVKWMERVFPVVWTGDSKHIVWDSMRAHIGQQVKDHCRKHDIEMCVVPGGMTPYLQAGDIGIYKSYKDHISELIDSRKGSDNVQYKRGGNPKPPSIEIVTEWVRQAWRRVSPEIVQRSIALAGCVDDYTEWHIARHDVYGEQFKAAWLEKDHNDMANPVDTVLCEALDDISIIDE